MQPNISSLPAPQTQQVRAHGAAPCAQRSSALLAAARLLTPRLLLQPAVTGNAGVLARLQIGDDVRRALFSGEPRRCADAAGNDGTGLWVIALAGSAEPVGFAGLHRGSVGAAIESSIALRSDHRGRGHAQEALKMLLARAQRAQAPATFSAVCAVPDTAADRLLRRLGFVPGYEADGDPWRLRQYRLPPPVAATP